MARAAEQHPAVFSATDAEESLIGLLVLDASKQWRCEGLTEEDFTSATARWAWRAISALQTAGEPVDLVTVSDAVRKLSGESHSSQLAQAVEQAGVTPEPLVRMIREASLRRRMDATGHVLRQLAREREVSREGAMEALDKLVAALTDTQADREALLRDVAIERVEFLSTREPGTREGIDTEFRELDDKLGGFKPKDLIVLGARPSQGKSALAHQIATRTARRGERVLVCSPEMPGEAVADRIIAQEGPLALHALRNSMLDAASWAAARDVAADLPEMFLFDKASMTSRDIEGMARRVVMRFGKLDLLIVDHLHYLDDQARGRENRTDVVGRAARNMKNLARVLACPVLLLAQLNRQNEQGKVRRPMPSDLRDSGNVEQDADVIVFLHRPEYYEPTDRPGIAEVIVAKNRNGPTGTVTLGWHATTTRFTELT